jgi:hypothetical protein
MKDKQQKQPVSPQKLAANRANAQRSSGPQTVEGKARSSQNAYQHGFYAKRLFPTKELVDRDWADYNRILAAYRSHYSPVGDLENLCVEQIAVQSLRLARLLGHEEKILALGTPFEVRSMDKIPRYESTVTRQLEKVIDRMERLQEKRHAESNLLEPSDLEADDAISEPDEETQQRSEAPADVVPEEPREVSTSSTAPDVEASAKQGSAPVDGEPSNRQAETSASNPPTPENCATKNGGQTFAKLIERVAGLPPAEEHNRDLG